MGRTIPDLKPYLHLKLHAAGRRTAACGGYGGFAAAAATRGGRALDSGWSVRQRGAGAARRVGFRSSAARPRPPRWRGASPPRRAPREAVSCCTAGDTELLEFRVSNTPEVSLHRPRAPPPAPRMAALPCPRSPAISRRRAQTATPPDAPVAGFALERRTAAAAASARRLFAELRRRPRARRAVAVSGDGLRSQWVCGGPWRTISWPLDRRPLGPSRGGVGATERRRRRRRRRLCTRTRPAAHVRLRNLAAAVTAPPHRRPPPQSTSAAAGIGRSPSSSWPPPAY